MRDKVECSAKIKINRINLTLRTNSKVNKIRQCIKLVVVDLTFEKPW